MMSDAIKSFAKQFAFEPKIENAKNFKRHEKFIVAGMGGSHLAADLLKTYDPALCVMVHSDYGLPSLSDEALSKRLIIASSYSGNTEETIDAFNLAVAKNLPLLAIAVGGKLLELAKKHTIPYIQLSDTGIQPRSALGLSMKAMLAAMGQQQALAEAGKLVGQLEPEVLQPIGQELARRLNGRIPIIYASARNVSLAYNWKIKFNETGKIPAFYNVFPELNHNEMTGFDIKDSSRGLSEKFYFIILRDGDDHPRSLKRMAVLEQLYRDRGLPVEMFDIDTLSGSTSKLHKMFSCLLLADWAAVHTAEQYGLESEQVPMVEEFKQLIA